MFSLLVGLTLTLPAMSNSTNWIADMKREGCILEEEEEITIYPPNQAMIETK